MSRVQFVRQMLPRICKDFYEMEIYHNPTGAATFDPNLTTSVSTTIIWQTEAGTTVTTGTTHDLSYTPTAGPKVCKVTVLAGLRAVTGAVLGTDAIFSISNLNKCNIATISFDGNPNLTIPVSTFKPGLPTSIIAGSGATISGVFPVFPKLTYIEHTGAKPSAISTPLCFPAIVTLLLNGNIGFTGLLSDLAATVRTCTIQECTGITPASIAHLVAIRDIRIYSMGWTAQQNTDVLLSAWGARANYTYAGGLQLRISAPTGTPGTEPPAAGESNADWSWNAGTSRHDPLTGYAVKADLENDFYTEGFKTWTVTIL